MIDFSPVPCILGAPGMTADDGDRRQSGKAAKPKNKRNNATQYTVQWQEEDSLQLGTSILDAESQSIFQRVNRDSMTVHTVLSSPIHKCPLPSFQSHILLVLVPHIQQSSDTQNRAVPQICTKMVVPFLLKRKRSCLMQVQKHITSNEAMITVDSAVQNTRSSISSSTSCDPPMTRTLQKDETHVLEDKENNNAMALALESPSLQLPIVTSSYSKSSRVNVNCTRKTNMICDDGTVLTTPRMFAGSSSMVSPCHYHPLKTPNPLKNSMTDSTTNNVTPSVSTPSQLCQLVPISDNHYQEAPGSSMIDTSTSTRTDKKKQRRAEEDDDMSPGRTTGGSESTTSSPEPICFYELSQENASSLFQNESTSVVERDEILNAADCLCQLKSDTTSSTSRTRSNHHAYYNHHCNNTKKRLLDTNTSSMSLPQSFLGLPLLSSSNRSSPHPLVVEEEEDSTTSMEYSSHHENDFFLQVPRGSQQHNYPNKTLPPILRQKKKRLTPSQCDEIVNSIVNSSWKSLPTVLTKTHHPGNLLAEPKPFSVPSNYPNRLALPKDRDELNSLHCFVRSELLELFVVPSPENQVSNQHKNNSTRTTYSEKNSGKRKRRSCTLLNESLSLHTRSSDEEQDEESEYEDGPVTRRRCNNRDHSQSTKKSTSSYGSLTTSSVRLFPGRVGLRCVHCAHLPRQKQRNAICENTSSKASMPLFYPKSLNDLYRSVCTWQRVHFRNCPHIPTEVRETYWALKEGDRTRGKTKYWLVSAKKLGLVDSVGVHNRGGIQFSTK